MNKGKPRGKVPPDMAAEVIFMSDRTCCICRKPRKTLQIHHIDDNNNNNSQDNLAVLCLECHDDTQLKGGFGRKLDSHQVYLYREDWFGRVEQHRAKEAEYPDWLRDSSEKVNKSLPKTHGLISGDKMVATLRANVETLDVERAKRCRETILSRYLERTIIRHATTNALASNDYPNGYEGKYIWLERDLEEFNRGNVFYGLFCNEIAEAMASGEHAYLLQTLKENSPSYHKLSFTRTKRPHMSQIEEQVDELIAVGNQPNVMLAPIQAYVDFMNHFRKAVDWGHVGREYLEIKDKARLALFWSHRGITSQEFIIFNRHAVKWTTKADKEDGALATAIGASSLYKDKVHFFAQTAFKVEIMKPEAIKVISLPE